MAVLYRHTLFAVLLFVVSIAIGMSLDMFLSTSPASASTIDDLKQKISDNTAEINKVQQDIAKYQQQINETSKQANTLKTQIYELDLTDKKLQSDIRLTQGKITTTERTINELDGTIGTEERAIDTAHNALAEGLREQSEIDAVPIAAIALGEGTFSAFWDRAARLASFEGGIDEHLVQVRDLKRQLEDSKQQKEGEKSQLVFLKSDLASQHQTTIENKQQKDQLLFETKNEESTYQKLLVDRKKRMQELQDEITSYEAELRIAIDPASLPTTGAHVLAYPLDAVRITQYFGTTPFATANPQVYGGHGHNGIDLGASVGTPVHAAADGVVVDTGDTDISCYKVSYGRWVLIRHGNGLSTLYAHLSAIGVSPGEQITRGEQIGLSGNTGYTTGPHVHFTVYATAGVQVTSKYVSKVCGTKMKLPLASLNAYLNPLSYL